MKHHGGVAQLGEHLPCKQGVKGSNPFISTKSVVNRERADDRGAFKAEDGLIAQLVRARA